MKFLLAQKKMPSPHIVGEHCRLEIDLWNDFGYVTQFRATFFDSHNIRHDIGKLKIGFKGQKTQNHTYKHIPHEFNKLGKKFFSLGCNSAFYENIATLPTKQAKSILIALRDIANTPIIIDEVRTEDVFSTSILRDASLSLIKGQYSRILANKAALSDFSFKLVRKSSSELGEISMDFKVQAESRPSTNIHAIIGRNGTGKTTLLNGMIESIALKNKNYCFFDLEKPHEPQIPEDYFSSVISISFSAFDPFTPPAEQPDPAEGTCYFYIGLKSMNNPDSHLTIPELHRVISNALFDCFENTEKADLWRRAIHHIESDDILSALDLSGLQRIFSKITVRQGVKEREFKREEFSRRIIPFLSRLSSGHAITLLMISRLVATVQEKTLVLIDEPESHLHPPLLSAVLRSLSDLLHEKNGVAIIATHSPVVIQEIPKSCVWKLYRSGAACSIQRPTRETFGENVGTLTSDVFCLEVERSGFHKLLSDAASEGASYDDIIKDFNKQLGIEGRAILQSLIANRDHGEQ